MDSIWLKPQRSFKDLREFLAHLESRGELKTIDAPVSPALELTEISRRVLAKRGPGADVHRRERARYPRARATCSAPRTASRPRSATTAARR